MLSLEALRGLNDAPPFHRWLGCDITAVDADTGLVCLRQDWRAEFSRAAEEGEQAWHGGVLAALIDIAGDYAVALHLERGVPTIDLRVDYLRMGRPGPLIAAARAIKIGRRIALADISLREEAGGREIAVGRGVYSCS